MIALHRSGGRPVRVGHRGAARLASENTIGSFRAALEAGVDVVEFDVVSSSDGELVVAHGREDIHGESPTLEEAFEFFVGEASETGLHVDLKLRGRETEIAGGLRRRGLHVRALVTSPSVGTARAIRAVEPGIRTGITFPQKMLGISDSGRGAPAARAGLRAIRSLTPFVVGRLLALSGAGALSLHHALVTPAAVRAAHARGVPVITWTVDDDALLARVVEAGVDAVVTNDPRIFASTLDT